MGRQITNCSECAYVDKSGNSFWCPFHDEAVSSKLVCDDFLDEYEAPQWVALAAGMNGEQEDMSRVMPKDILMYVVTVILWVLCIAYFVITVVVGFQYK